MNQSRKMYGRLLICYIIVPFCVVFAPPPRRETEPPPTASTPPGNADNVGFLLNFSDEIFQQLNLPYERYLMEVVRELEKDENFQKKLQALPEADVKAGKIADHLDELGLDVRSRLTDIKVREIERLRDVVTKELELNKRPEGDHDVDGLQAAIDKHTAHIDVGELASFNKEDLRKLVMRTVADLDELDKARRADFKEYELKKEALRQHQMAGMTEEQRKQAERAHEEEIRKHKQHPDINHPGGKEQLEEVWEEKDKMKGNEFDPKTFFNLHDLDGNGQWDEMELEALFQNELDKIDEEMNRMREHVEKEMDKDHNRMISLDEFLGVAKTDEFKNDDNYKPLDEEKIYTDDELKRFEEEYAKQMNWGDNAYPQPPGHVPPVAITQPQPVPVQHNQNQPQQQAQPQQAQPQQAPQQPDNKPIDRTYGV